MPFLVFEVCVYTHMPLPRDAGHGFGLGVVVGLGSCSMDGCAAFLVRPTCRSVQSVQNSCRPSAPLLHRATARELFRLVPVRSPCRREWSAEGGPGVVPAG